MKQRQNQLKCSVCRWYLHFSESFKSNSAGWEYFKNLLIILPLVLIIVIILAFLFQSRWKSSNFHGLENKQTDEVLLYFYSVAFREDNQRIMKWKNPITVQLIKPFNQKDSVDVNKLINELIEIGIPIKMVDHMGNLKLFLPENEIEYYKLQKVKNPDEKRDIYGFVSYGRMGINGEIKSAEIVINPTSNRDHKRERTIRHEFMHALGLSNHTKIFFNSTNLLGAYNFKSIEEFEKNDDSYVPNLDKAALKILYSKELPSFLRKKDFKKVMQLENLK